MATHPGMPRNVMPPGFEDDPMAPQNIQCLWRGGRAALIQTK